MDKRLKESQMRRVAELYYEQSLSQHQIAKILGCSHSTVSRLLAEARETGIVRITIRRSVENLSDVARQMRRIFDLRDAVVVPDAGSAEANLRRIGEAAAEYLLSVVDNNMVVGVTWGYTLYHMVKALQPVNLEGVEVIQLSGSLGQGNPEVDGPKLAFALANCLNGNCRLLPAPAVVASEEIRDTLMSQPQIQRTMERAANADILIQGIGVLDDKLSSLERAGYIHEVDRAKAIKNGAVGHVFARMIDINGVEVGDYSKRVVAIPLETMRNATWSIAISASVQKAPAILGALRGGYFNTIIVDEMAAWEVLRLAGAVDTPGEDEKRA